MKKLKPDVASLPKLSIPEGTKDMVSIEELSPEAIIPDSMTVYRDPEVEIPEEGVPEGGSSPDMELGRKFTEIDLDRMSDGSRTHEDKDHKGDHGNNERLARRGQKRKHGSVDGSEPGDLREPRKKIPSPSKVASPIRTKGR